MPPPNTVQEYIGLLEKTGLVPEDQLKAALEEISNRPNPPQTIDQFINAAIRKGLLTVFQSKQIRLGRYKKFVLNNKYRILELIGTGGMGAVYLCEHKFMRRLVAVKILPADKYDDPSNLERFVREARAVAALNHPNIVRAYDIDKAEGMHFLVMEYVDGSSLQEIVARFGPLNPLRAAHCIAQAAIGLQHAQEKGLVHRDIKPGNLLVERTGVVKLLDMGLARFFEPARDDKLTEKYDEKCVLGTADYLAPEQAISNKVDIRADIYGLGGTLYFMLTGRSPVPDGNVTQKLMFHQKMEPTPVSEFRKDVPPAIIDILTKMMKKNPADRYQTPMEVAEALSPWAEQYTNAPAEFEMPDLCPAVSALVGHSLGAKTNPSTGSGAIRFAMVRTKSAESSKASSGVAIATKLPPATSPSAVDFKPPAGDQGSTLPNMKSVSPTTPLPKSGPEAFSAETQDVSKQFESLSSKGALRSMSDVSLVEEETELPTPRSIKDSSDFRIETPKKKQTWIWVTVALTLVMLISAIVAVVMKR